MLAEELAGSPGTEEALAGYEERRKAELAATQGQADASAAWHEQVDRHVDRPGADFAKLMRAADRRSWLGCRWART